MPGKAVVVGEEDGERAEPACGVAQGMLGRKDEETLAAVGERHLLERRAVAVGLGVDGGEAVVDARPGAPAVKRLGRRAAGSAMAARPDAQNAARSREDGCRMTLVAGGLSGDAGGNHRLAPGLA